jgi:hypothetical protein
MSNLDSAVSDFLFCAYLTEAPPPSLRAGGNTQAGGRTPHRGFYTYHDVNMRRSHGMSVQESQQLEAWSVSRQAVCGWVVAQEVVFPVFVGTELAPEIVVRLVVWVLPLVLVFAAEPIPSTETYLEIIFAIRRGLPDVENGSWDALAGGEVGDGAVHPADPTALAGVLDYGGAEIAERRVWRPEGPENRGRGRVDIALGNDFVGDFVHQAIWRNGNRPGSATFVSYLLASAYSIVPKQEQAEKAGLGNLRFETENVGDAMRLVPCLGRDLADGVDEVHARHPLVHRQLDFAGKVVQVPNQAAQHLPVPRRDVGADGLEDVVREVGVEAVRGLGCLSVGAVDSAIGAAVQPVRGHCELWVWSVLAVSASPRLRVV